MANTGSAADVSFLHGMNESTPKQGPHSGGTVSLELDPPPPLGLPNDLLSLSLSLPLSLALSQCGVTRYKVPVPLANCMEEGLLAAFETLP